MYSSHSLMCLAPTIQCGETSSIMVNTVYRKGLVVYDNRVNFS